jgi:hypothetical protein
MLQQMKILYRKCDVCPHEFEIEWDGVTDPVANGHMPTDQDNEGWVWEMYHGRIDCDYVLVVMRSDFDNL